MAMLLKNWAPVKYPDYSTNRSHKMASMEKKYMMA